MDRGKLECPFLTDTGQYKASVWSVINSVPDGDDSHEDSGSFAETTLDATIRR
jgi:hypothetical protein